jgi:hypothetical protein
MVETSTVQTKADELAGILKVDGRKRTSPDAEQIIGQE